jgi:hypothetical protein
MFRVVHISLLLPDNGSVLLTEQKHYSWPTACPVVFRKRVYSGFVGCLLKIFVGVTKCNALNHNPQTQTTYLSRGGTAIELEQHRDFTMGSTQVTGRSISAH